MISQIFSKRLFQCKRRLYGIDINPRGCIQSQWLFTAFGNINEFIINHLSKHYAFGKVKQMNKDDEVDQHSIGLSTERRNQN